MIAVRLTNALISTFRYLLILVIVWISQRVRPRSEEWSLLYVMSRRVQYDFGLRDKSQGQLYNYFSFLL